MTKKKSKQNKEKQVPQLSLGQALKDCRLVAKLSVDEVADSLNLKSTLIKDLEDNLDKIIDEDVYPKIYLRGYLANYAKEIGLSNINSFPQFQQLSAPVKSTAHLRTPDIIPNKKGLPKKVKWALLTLLLLPIIIAALFFFSSPETNDVSQVTPVKAENASMRLPVAKTESETENTIESEVPAQEAKVVVMSTAESASVDSQDEVLPVAQESAIAEQPTVVQLPVIESEAVVNEPEQAEIAKQTLVLKFKEDCWTEIYDANGEKLALDLYKAGKELTLAGTPPFNLVLGNPFVVDIFYQGELFEKQFKKGRTARFNLPE